ncbi:MAG: hypothetical protein H0V39_04005 [Nitrosomonas sp.]|nr:hypothetical protein [Nitrosomonas sp.]
MTKKSIGKCIQGQVIVADPIPPASDSGRIRLGNIKDVRYEIAKVYREARTGLIPTQEATRLVYMLISLGNMIKDTELEERIIKMEKLSDKS